LPDLVEEFNMGLTTAGLHHFVVNTFETFVLGLHLLVGIIYFVPILHEEKHDPGDVLGLRTTVVPEMVFHDGRALGGPLTAVSDVDGGGVLMLVVRVVGDDTVVFGDFFIVLTVIVSGDLLGPNGAALFGDTLHFTFQDHMGTLDVKPALVDDLEITAVELEGLNEVGGVHGITEPVIHTYQIESVVVVGVVGVVGSIVIDGDRGGSDYGL